MIAITAFLIVACGSLRDSLMFLHLSDCSFLVTYICTYRLWLLLQVVFGDEHSYVSLLLQVVSYLIPGNSYFISIISYVVDLGLHKN